MRTLVLCLLLHVAVSTAPFALAQDNDQANDLAPPNPTVALWNQQLAEVTTALGPQLNCDAPVIVDAAQLPGHGPSVALVKPCPTGDRATQLAVLILENGKPVVARFRDPSGNPMIPKLERSKSPLKPRDTQLDPSHGDITTTAQDRNDHNQYEGCFAAVFTWNTKTQTFDWNPKKSKKQFSTYCIQ